MAETFFEYSKNIFVRDDYKPYRDEVVRYLDLIKTTFTGRTLFEFFRRNPLGRFVQIVPFKPTDDDPVNAYADAKRERDSYGNGRPLMKKYTLTNGDIIMLPTGQFGTGVGSNAQVSYHPATWRQYNQNMRGVPPGTGPGEVLFHEMIHALRMASGKLIRTTVAERIHMDNFEEFCAIVAANIYRSERGFKLLRQDHWGAQAESKDLSKSETFYITFQDQFKMWFQSQKDFCKVMASSKADFNPLSVAAEELGYLGTAMA